jgi:fatty-acyl-CoA synthase
LLPTVTQLLAPLAEVDDRGVRSIDGPMVSWRQHIQDGAALAALLRSRLDPDRPPHVGVLLGNTPLFSALLVAAGLGGVVPVGLNPTRRGAALRRDITHADCQLVLTDTTPDSYQGAFPEGTPVLDVGTTEWADELDSCTGAPVRFADSAADDLFMLIFTSGTGGDPKAVRCTHEKVAVPGVMLAERFGLTPEDVFYLSMPLFHSNAIMAGWAPAVAAGGEGSPPQRSSTMRGGFGLPTPTTSASRCPISSRRPSAPTTPTTRCGSCTATRRHPATSAGSRGDSV